MMRNYETPELMLIRLELTDTILTSIPTPSGNEMPILGGRSAEQELVGGGGLDAEDAVTPTEPMI